MNGGAARGGGRLCDGVAMEAAGCSSGDRPGAGSGEQGVLVTHHTLPGFRRCWVSRAQGRRPQATPLSLEGPEGPEGDSPVLTRKDTGRWAWTRLSGSPSGCHQR